VRNSPESSGRNLIYILSILSIDDVGDVPPAKKMENV